MESRAHTLTPANDTLRVRTDSPESGTLAREGKKDAAYSMCSAHRPNMRPPFFCLFLCSVFLFVFVVVCCLFVCF